MRMDISIPEFLVHDLEDMVLNSIVRLDTNIYKIIISTSQYGYDRLKYDYFKYRGKEVRLHSSHSDVKNIKYGTYGRLSKKLKYLDADLYCVERSNKSYISIANPSVYVLNELASENIFNVEIVCYTYKVFCNNEMSLRYVYSCIRNNGYFRKANGRINVKDCQDGSLLCKNSGLHSFEIYDEMCELDRPIVRVEEEIEVIKEERMSFVVNITLWAYADRRGRNMKIPNYLHLFEEHSRLARYLTLKRCYWTRKATKKQVNDDIPYTSLNLMKKYSESRTGLKLANVGRSYDFLKKALGI